MTSDLTPQESLLCNRGVDGEHCCFINGEVCKFLGGSDLLVCTVWDKMDGVKWKNAPVGLMFAERWPGYNCKDWPQNIPEVMAVGIGLCCSRPD